MLKGPAEGELVWESGGMRLLHTLVLRKSANTCENS